MTQERNPIPAHKFERDQTVPTKTMMFHGKSKMCKCGLWSWHIIHDPENWAERYTRTSGDGVTG